MRVLLAALVGGIIMFAWGAIAHMFTPLGHMGMSTLTDEDIVVPAISQSTFGAGLYVFPGEALTNPDNFKPEGPFPWGMIIFDPNRTMGMAMPMLYEFASNVLAALFAAVIAAAIAAPAIVRAVLVMFIGVIGWLSISASYWTWYHFPREFVLAEGVMQVAGWLATGIAIAIILKPARSSHEVA